MGGSPCISAAPGSCTTDPGEKKKREVSEIQKFQIWTGVPSVGRGAVCLQMTQQSTWLHVENYFFLILWCSIVRVRSTEHACICFLLHVIEELKILGLLVYM